MKVPGCASAFIPSVIGFSASSPSVVGLRLPFSLFVISCSRVCPRQLKMVYPDYVKQRILFYRRLGKSFVQITRCLAEEGHATTKVGVCKFIRRTKKQGSRVRQEAKTSSSTALRRYIVLGKMHKQLAPPLWSNLLTLARSIGVYLVRTCYTRCIIKKRPFAYAYYTHT